MYVCSLCSGLAHRHRLLPLLAQLLAGQRELPLGEVRELEPLHDAPLAVLDGDGEAEHDAHRRVVAAVGEHAHAHPVALGRGAEPGLHVVRSSLGKYSSELRRRRNYESTG